MGRIKNAILDKQHEFEYDLATLRQQLADKESESLNFELQEYMDSFRNEIWTIKRRLDILETKQQQFVVEPKSTTLLSIIAVIAAIYYRYR